jgi:hypothetical protein
MITRPTGRLRQRAFAIGAALLGTVVAAGIVVNALLAPPPKPAGTNNVVTGEFQREEYPNVPSDEQYTSTTVNGCKVVMGTYGAWPWTTDSFRLRFDVTSMTSAVSSDPSTELVYDGPDQNIWGSTTFDQMAKVGHSYRFGPATVKVLQVWNSPLPQYRRAYLKVTFDKSQVLCPPPKTYAAE